MKMRFSARISSATAVVGPLAPSTTMRALILSALRLVITFSVAAGIRISQSARQQLFAGHGFRAAEAENRVVAVLVLEQLVNVDAVGVEQAAVPLGDADNLVALLHASAARRSSPRCRNPG